MSAGAKFKAGADRGTTPAGDRTVCAYHAVMGRASATAPIYLSGAGVAASLARHARPRISTSDTCSPISGASPTCATCAAVSTSTPGFGASAFNIARDTPSSSRRRCGHAYRRPGRRQALRPPVRQGACHRREMADRVKARSTRGPILFVVMARTDALANEGLDAEFPCG